MGRRVYSAAPSPLCVCPAPSSSCSSLTDPLLPTAPLLPATPSLSFLRPPLCLEDLGPSAPLHSGGAAFVPYAPPQPPLHSFPLFLSLLPPLAIPVRILPLGQRFSPQSLHQSPLDGVLAHRFLGLPQTASAFPAGALVLQVLQAVWKLRGAHCWPPRQRAQRGAVLMGATPPPSDHCILRAQGGSPEDGWSGGAHHASLRSGKASCLPRP